MTDQLFERDENGVPQPRRRGPVERQKSEAERRQNITAALILVAMLCMTAVALCGLGVWAWKS